MPCPRTKLPSALPWKQRPLEARGRTSLTPVQGAWRGGRRPPLHLATGLSFRFPAPSLPSWASSAGINTIKGMFSL